MMRSSRPANRDLVAAADASIAPARMPIRTPVHVVAVSSSTRHALSKRRVARINLLTGLGVEGDAHCGRNVQHRSRVARDPSQPNLRQVHLIQAELFDELLTKGFRVSAGELGENIATSGIDLLALPAGTELHIGASARVRVTGLRNPCTQLDGFQRGLMSALLDHANDGTLVRRAGVMGIVLSGGFVAAGDTISIVLPTEPHRPLEPV